MTHHHRLFAAPIIALATAALITTSLTGCGKDAQDPAAKTTTDKAEGEDKSAKEPAKKPAKSALSVDKDSVLAAANRLAKTLKASRRAKIESQDDTGGMSWHNKYVLLVGEQVLFIRVQKSKKMAAALAETKKQPLAQIAVKDDGRWGIIASCAFALENKQKVACPKGVADKLLAEVLK